MNSNGLRPLDIDELPTPRFDRRTNDIWRALVNGPLTAAEIGKHVSWSPAEVKRALGNLETCDLVAVCADEFRWRITTRGVAVINRRHRDWLDTTEDTD